MSNFLFPFSCTMVKKKKLPPKFSFDGELISERDTNDDSPFNINFEDSDETMSVKASNLLQHVHVRIHDIQSQPELNGKTGTIITWLEAKGRYNIYIMALKKAMSIKPGNLILEDGTVAQDAHHQTHGGTDTRGEKASPEVLVDWLAGRNVTGGVGVMFVNRAAG